MDVIVAIALLAAGLMVIVSLIPSGVLSLKKAENLQTAAAYAMDVIETSRGGVEQTPWLDQFRVTLNDTEFRVKREARPVPQSDGRLVDVQVTIEWDQQPTPVRVATRMRTVEATPDEE